MSKKSFLPSKKFVFVLIAFFIAGGLFFVGKNNTFVNKKTSPLSSIKASEFVQLDSDKDGLYDWEESLWGTDPKKPDTDNNGISDKQELDSHKKSLGLETKEDNASLSETERLARELFTIIVALDEKGALDDEAINNISKTFGTEIASGKQIPDPLPNPQIKTLPINTENKSLYVKKVKELTAIAEKGNMGKEFDVISKSINEEDETLLLDLSPISEAYKNFALGMLEISAPEDIKDVHAVLIRESLRTAIAVKNLQSLYSNPVVGMSGLIQYSNYSRTLQKGLFALNSYFQTK